MTTPAALRPSAQPVEGKRYCRSNPDPVDRSTAASVSAPASKSARIEPAGYHLADDSNQPFISFEMLFPVLNRGIPTACFKQRGRPVCISTSHIFGDRDVAQGGKPATLPTRTVRMTRNAFNAHRSTQGGGRERRQGSHSALPDFTAYRFWRDPNSEIPAAVFRRLQTSAVVFGPRSHDLHSQLHT